MDRRSFLTDTARAVAAVGLGGAVGSLVGRDRSSEKCINQGICGGCGRFASCHLPQALSAKEATAGGANRPGE
ncbi:MAG TPA: hypothetical protein DGT21_01655 [Armatimonadetes bacterium]|nr:hypothetical protein [Armatimonadota bacterium]